MSSALNGMPYFLEASSGDILNTDYTELYKRMNYRIRCTHRDPNLGRAAYMITEMSAPSTAGRPGVAAPFAALDFIADDQLGTVKVGSGEQMPMDQYLAKVSRNDSLTRKYKATDGQEYIWTYHTEGDCDWTCSNTKGYQVAAYDSSRMVRDASPQSASRHIYIEEGFQHLAGDLVTSLTIMRFIRKHGL